MKWLIDCTDVAIPEIPDLPAVENSVSSSPARIRVEDNGEPLVPLAEAIRLYPVYSWLGFKHMPPTQQARAGLVERLRRASANLPTDFALAVIDAHRTRQFQAELQAYYRAQTKQPLDDFVSDPYSTSVVPPHVTGGAVDLTLAWRGAVLGLGTDFDEFLTESAPAALESIAHPDTARDLRRLLASVLSAEHLVVIHSEWWHWSYGDQWWATQTGAPAAIYGEVTLISDEFLGDPTGALQSEFLPLGSITVGRIHITRNRTRCDCLGDHVR